MTEGKRNQKQAGSEVKIFLVPLNLLETKGNISINTANKPSEDKIINDAFKFHSKGKIAEATKYYEHFIHQGFIRCVASDAG